MSDYNKAALLKAITPLIHRYGSDAIVETMAEYFRNNIKDKLSRRSDGAVYTGQRTRAEMLEVFGRILRNIGSK